MMPSSSIHDRSDKPLACCLSPGSAHARVEQLEWPAIAPAVSLRNAHATRSPLHARARRQANTAARPLRCKLLKPYPAAKSP
jgi:hypothetical protein